MTYLLWTERPVRIPREEETHAWMEANRPWERFGLTLVHDTAPGDWRHYAEVFRRVWAKAESERTGFINIESDVVPTLLAFEQVLQCPEPSCCVPYKFHSHLDRKVVEGYGANFEKRVPGGWEARLVREGEEWAVQSDLGFVRYSAELVQRIGHGNIPSLDANYKCLHELMARVIQGAGHIPRERTVHLHWPGLTNNHYVWDEGDDAHWTPEQAAHLRLLRERMFPGTVAPRASGP